MATLSLSPEKERFMEAYDQYDRFDKYNVVKKNKTCKRQSIKSVRLATLLERKINSKKLTKNINRCRKNLLIDRRLPLSGVYRMIKENVCDGMVDKICNPRCYCYYYGHFCLCHKLWYDDYDLYFQEFDQMFRKYLKNTKQNDSQKLKLDLINFFSKTIPKFFRIVIYGDVVMGMISGIHSDCIDMMVYDFNELKKFMIIIHKLFEPHDKYRSSYVISRDDQDESVTEKNLNFLGSVSIYKIYYVVSCVCFIDQIEIRFNIKMRLEYGIENWRPDFDFIETQIMFGKMSDMCDREICARIGANKIGFAMHTDNYKYKYYDIFGKRHKDVPFKKAYDINVVKKNLVNKKLTVSREEKELTWFDVKQKIETIKTYYDKIARGYIIPDPCRFCDKPEGLILHFSFKFEQFDNVVYNVTKINTDVNFCIYGYLQIDGTICTYCNIPFNTLDEKQNQLIAVTPACKCGKKKYTTNDENEDDDENYDDIFGWWHDDCGLAKYCGEKENPCNAFHVDCFLADKRNFIGSECRCCLCNVFTSEISKYD